MAAALVNAEELGREALRLRRKGRCAEAAVLHAQAADLLAQAARQLRCVDDDSAATVGPSPPQQATCTTAEDAIGRIAAYHAQQAAFLRAAEAAAAARKPPTPMSPMSPLGAEQSNSLFTSFFMMAHDRRAHHVALSPSPPSSVAAATTTATPPKEEAQQTGDSVGAAGTAAESGGGGGGGGIDLEALAADVAAKGSPRTRAVVRLLLARLARLKDELEASQRHCREVEAELQLQQQQQQQSRR